VVGKTLGHYEVLEPLGAGGTGEVYLGVTRPRTPQSSKAAYLVVWKCAQSTYSEHNDPLGCVSASGPKKIKNGDCGS